MHISQIIPILGLWVGLTACEQLVELDLGQEEPRLVVLASFSDLDTLEVVVSQSNAALEPQSGGVVVDAVVEIYQENGTFIDRLDYTGEGFYRAASLVPQVGKGYLLRVSAPGFEPVEAVSVIPPPRVIDTASVELDLEVTEEGPIFNRADFEISLNIKDNPGSDDFYHLVFYQEAFNYRIGLNGDTLKQQFFSLPLSVELKDDQIPAIPYIESRGLLVRDEDLPGLLAFDGSFLYRRNDQLLGDFIIELRSVSEDYFLYHASLARQAQAGSDPLSEPVILFTNIQNGYGVFGGFVSRFFALDFPL